MAWKEHSYKYSVVAVSAVVLSFFCCLLLRHALIDDAFIFLKVADNILQYGEYSFNQSEIVNPISSPLFLFGLIALRGLGIAPELSLLLLWGTGLALTFFFGFLIFEKRPFPLIVLVCVGLVGQSSLLRSAGMETSLYVALLLGCAYCFEEKKQLLTGIFLAGILLIRLEGFLILFPFLALSIVEKRLPWKEICIALVPALFYALFCVTYFDNPLPASVMVKALQSDLGLWKEQSYFQYFLIPLAAPILTLILVVFGLSRLFKSNGDEGRGVVLVVSYGILQTLVFSVSSAPSLYFWYRVPGYVALMILSAYALAGVYEYLEGKAIFGTGKTRPYIICSLMCFPPIHRIRGV